MEFDIQENLVVLFQGDSVTDVGRDRAAYYANNPNGMGQGYAFHAASTLLGVHPRANTKYYNRGVGGNKVFELANRWEEDALMLKPDVLSILIGVNDYWHTLSHGYKGSAKTYEADYRQLLDRTKKHLPNVKLMIGEPFAIKGGTAIQGDGWDSTFKTYQKIAEKIAQDYDAKFIPYQSIFETALEKAPVSYWCPDGVHPSMAGHYLMAEAWMRKFYELR
jgi:lysophospholipase L1-like esterase